jgi:hypothetical protein
MAIVIKIKIKLLSREYTATVNSADVNRRIKAVLTKTRMITKSSLRNLSLTMVNHLPRVSVTTFKFSNEYLILVNTDKRLAPYMEDVKTLVSRRAEKAEGLRSVVLLPTCEIEENPDIDLKIILISEKEEYSEEVEAASNGRMVKIIVSGKNKEAISHLNTDALSSKGLVLYGDEFLESGP